MEQNNLKGINYADLEALEQERQDIGKKLSKILFYGIGGAVVGGIFLASIKLGNLFIFLLVGVVGYLGKTTIELKNNFRANFKQKVVTAIVKNYGLNFNANGSLSVYDFYQIYDTDVSEYRGEDLIFGKVDNTEFKLCDFYAAKVTKSGKHTHTTVKFEGILLKAEFKKTINATN